MTIQLSPKLQDIGGGVLLYYCPGCEEPHAIPTQTPYPNGAKWSFDGNVDKPTFSPSVHRVGVCHHFVQAGKIAFCSDCTHALAGQTVDLPDIPTDFL